MVRLIWLPTRFGSSAKWSARAQMEAHHAAAQEQPPEASVDEPNPAKVEPLC